MTKKAEKQYAMLSSTYGKNLMIPIHLLEQIVAEGYLVSTSYDNGEDHLNEVQPIRKVEMFSQSDLDTALAQQALQG